MNDNPGVCLVNVASYVNAAWYLPLAVPYVVCATIFSVNGFDVSNGSVGLTRSAALLILFIVIQAVGNSHVYKGPGDLNGYGYSYVRLYRAGFGLPANVVREYVLLSVLLQVVAGLKRAWDMKWALVKSQGLSALDLAIPGLMLLTPGNLSGYGYFQGHFVSDRLRVAFQCGRRIPLLSVLLHVVVGLKRTWDMKSS